MKERSTDVKTNRSTLFAAVLVLVMLSFAIIGISYSINQNNTSSSTDAFYRDARVNKLSGEYQNNNSMLNSTNTPLGDPTRLDTGESPFADPNNLTTLQNTQRGGGISVGRCMVIPGRKCLPKDVCLSSGGSLVPGEGECSINGVSVNGTFCCQTNPEDEADLLVLESDCAKYGGTCKSVDPTDKSSCPIKLGICWDGGITSHGYCCTQNSGGSPANPVAPEVPAVPEVPGCSLEDGKCMSSYFGRCIDLRQEFSKRYGEGPGGNHSPVHCAECTMDRYCMDENDPNTVISRNSQCAPGYSEAGLCYVSGSGIPPNNPAGEYRKCCFKAN